jgi:hypothetical protein
MTGHVDGTGAAGGARDAAWTRRRTLARHERRERLRTLALDGAVVFGLAGLAVVQPLLDLFGSNPTFFVAGNYDRGQILAFALGVTLVPGAVLFVVSALLSLAGPRAGAIAHGMAVGLLAAVFGLVLARIVGVDATVPALAFALAVGAGVAHAEHSRHRARQFLAYLAIGNPAFLALFAFASPTAGLLLAGTSDTGAGEVTVPVLEGPVTVMVLDEFPLPSVLRPDGTINDVRYPNLAALAGQATWFRDAAAESAVTYESVPSILTGVDARDGALPVLQDHPRNLFTLFGDRYPVNSYEAVTDLCPPAICGDRPSGLFSQLLSDVAVVYQHRILPGGMRAGLPAVDQGWGQFGGGVGGGVSGGEVARVADGSALSAPSDANPYGRMVALEPSEAWRAGQAAMLHERVELIGSEPSVNLIHVLLPHYPYELTPWGVISRTTWLPSTMPDDGSPREARAFADLYGLQAMQLGAVDQLIGETVAHLQRTGAWDTGTFVLVSDHGVDITPPNFDREITEETADGVLRVPLFIKAPGQRTGEVRDDPASTLDVLPSLIDLLDIDADWEMDGHSLFDGSEPTHDRALGDRTFDDVLAYIARQRQFATDGDDWTSVVAIGDHADLVGSRVDVYDVGRPSALSWRYDHADALADPAAAGGGAPVLMTGWVAGSEEPPPDLVVALDGVIAGTIGGYGREDDVWIFTGLLGPEVEDGAERVVAYEVERDETTITLHPLVT